MSRNTNNALDRIDRNEKIKRWAFIFLILIGVGILVISTIPISTTNLTGTTIRLSAELTDEGNALFVWVKTDKNKILKATFPKGLVFVKDKNVALLQAKKIGGRSSYRVIGYIK